MRRHRFWLPAAVLLFGVTLFASVRFGALAIDTATVWTARWDYDPADHGQIVVRELRLHRTVIGVLAGACLAVAGALTQGVTRNPLGDPGILGISAGAAFAVVGAIYLVGISTPAGYVWFAFGGALGATLLFPIIGVALLISLLIGRQVNALSLGAAVAAGLGQRVAVTRALAGVLVVALAGSAVALAGPVAFVGLAVPHIVRSLVGRDYRLIIGYSMLLGPCLLLGADVIGRVIVAPSELQVGIVSAGLGAPFLICLVRRTRLAEL